MNAAPRWPLRHPALAAQYRRSGAWRGRTIFQDALDLAARQPDDAIVRAGTAALSPAGAVADAEALAASLWQLGLRPGDTVSVILPTCIEAVAINLAAARLGLVVNPIVPIYRSAELRHILRDGHTRAVFTNHRVRHLVYTDILDELQPELPTLAHRIHVDPAEAPAGALRLADLIAQGRGQAAPAPDADPAALKLVMYTSGTTGRAKGVLHSHDTLARVITMAAANWQLPLPPQAGPDGPVKMLVGTPIGHVAGYLWGLEAPFQLACPATLLQPWQPAEAVRLIDAQGLNIFTGAATFLRDLVDAARAAGSALPSLRRFNCGGAAVSPHLIREAVAVFANATAYRSFGCTEAPNITLGHAAPQDLRLAAETDGRPVDYEVRIVDDAGRDVPAGQDGEILARGPSVCLGYSDPAATAEAFDADGFFRTGDMGRFTPEGAVMITGRIKDLIIRGGENLSAKEIEDALDLHPAVQEAAVVGKPHPRLGEVVCACIVPAAGAAPTIADLAAHLERLGLARQKLPEFVHLVPALPRTPSGKVRKDQLRLAVRELA